MRFVKRWKSKKQKNHPAIAEMVFPVPALILTEQHPKYNRNSSPVGAEMVFPVPHHCGPVAAGAGHSLKRNFMPARHQFFGQVFFDISQ
jgi:hypothetical protein